MRAHQRAAASAARTIASPASVRSSSVNTVRRERTCGRRTWGTWTNAMRRGAPLRAASAPRQLDGQRLGGIERSPGKWPEAGDEDRGGHSSCLNDRKIFRRASAPAFEGYILSRIGVNDAALRASRELD